MTEEIIIDCAFYKDGVCASPINKTCEYCKNIDVSKCYHKQLKRLEQERDDLQGRLFALADTYQETRNVCKQLEQENKELKKQIESQKGLITVGGKQQYEITMSYDKCKTALEEIKAMINHPNHQGLLNRIEDKINEVLE